MMEEKQNYKRWIGLVAVSLGVFMSLLDVTVVNVALPTIQRSFNASFSNLQWVINAYTMVYAVVLLLMSKLGDMFGRKKIFIISMVIFTVASGLNAMSSSMEMLNVFRGLQAIGGSGMMSLSMAITASNFQGKERGAALGILSSIIGLSTAIGPLVGGYLVQAFSWRAIFTVNLPIGIIALILTVIFVDQGKQWPSKGKIDWLGIILSGLTVFGLILGLINKEGHYDWAWTNFQVGGYMGLAIVALILFIIWEKKSKAPMMDLAIFKKPTFTGAVIASFMLGAGLYAFYAYLTILMQNYIGYTALQTGTRQLLISGFALVLGPVAGVLSSKLSKRWMMSISMLIIAAGLLVMAHQITTAVTFAALWPAFILIGIGGATVNPPMTNAALEEVEPRHLGMASGILNVLRQFGVSFGIVFLGLRLTGGYRDSLTANLPKLHLPQQAAEGIHTALFKGGPFAGNEILQSPRAAAFRSMPGFADLKHTVFTAFDHGFTSVLFAGAAMLIIGAVAAAILVKDGKKEQNVAK